MKILKKEMYIDIAKLLVMVIKFAVKFIQKKA